MAALEHLSHAPETEAAQEVQAELERRQNEIDAIRKELEETRRISVFQSGDHVDDSALNMPDFDPMSAL